MGAGRVERSAEWSIAHSAAATYALALDNVQLKQSRGPCGARVQVVRYPHIDLPVELLQLWGEGGRQCLKDLMESGGD